MPPKSSTAKGKRARAKTDASTSSDQPKSKRTTRGKATPAATDSSNAPDATDEGWEDEQDESGYRIPHGPNGEVFMPSAMPKECVKALPKIPIPGRWVRAIDATPDRGLTLGSREWWESHGPWLDANRSKLGLKPAHWARRDKAMQEDVVIKDGEGRDEWDFVCLLPQEDEDEDEDEDDEDDDDDEDEDEDEDEENERGNKKKDNSADKALDGKLASLHPDYPFVASLRATDRLQWWILETCKRDQDDFMMHIYNDFSLYGQLEVLENILLQFDKVFKTDAALRDVWPEVEGLALFLSTGIIDFTMIDDPDRCGTIVEMIGNMTIAGMDFLKKQKALKPASSIPNIGYILSMLVKWAWELGQDHDCWEGNTTWVHHVVEAAEDAGITLAGPPRIEKVVNDIKAESKPKSALKKWKNVKWAAKLKSFRAGGRIGGDSFDITKMTAAERKQHSYSSGSMF